MHKNSNIPWDDWSEDVSFHSNPQRKRNDIKEEKVSGLGRCSLSGEDTSLDGGTVCDGLIRVDALLELLVVEELGKELLYPGNTGGTTNEHNLVNLALLETRVLEDLLNGLKGAGEGLGVEVFETGTGNSGGEVLAVEEGVDLDGGG